MKRILITCLSILILILLIIILVKGIKIGPLKIESIKEIKNKNHEIQEKSAEAKREAGHKKPAETERSAEKTRLQTRSTEVLLKICQNRRKNTDPSWKAASQNRTSPVRTG